MTLTQAYEINLLNELIAAMYENAACYGKAAVLLDNEHATAYRVRAENRRTSVDFLQGCVKALRGNPADSSSIVTAAYAAIGNTLFSTDQDTVSLSALAREDNKMSRCFEAAVVDPHLSKPIVDAIRLVGEKLELRLGLSEAYLGRLSFAGV